ncbi:hypothetical protein KEM52_006695 [Ascosphaera acerosa]|nr:hypothetical protein KEM52_006695 [Ascosphaera acerosa]
MPRTTPSYVYSSINDIESRIQQHMDTPGYIVFTNVPTWVPEKLSMMTDQGLFFKGVRLEYRSHTKLLEIKMPGRGHSVVATRACFILYQQLLQRGFHDVTVGGGPTTAASGGSMEPDGVLMRLSNAQYMLVVEVAISQSYADLVRKAQRWLTETQTEAVLTINAFAHSLQMEVWLRHPATSPFRYSVSEVTQIGTGGRASNDLPIPLGPMLGQGLAPGTDYLVLSVRDLEVLASEFNAIS